MSKSGKGRGQEVRGREEVGKVGNGCAALRLWGGMLRWTKRIEKGETDASWSGSKVGDEDGGRSGCVDDER